MQEITNQPIDNDTSTIVDNINNTYEKWKHWYMVSRIIRIIAWIVSFSSAGIGVLYTINQKGHWFSATLCGVSLFFISIILFGLLILILKPILYFIRKKSIGIHNELNQLESKLLDNYFHHINTKLESDRYSNSESEDVSNEYLNNENNMYSCLSRIRELKNEKARLCEWKWVKFAGFVIILIGLFALAVVLFSTMVAVLVVIGAVVFYGGGTTYYNYHYEDNYKDDNEGLLSLLFDSIADSDKHIDDEILQMENTLEKLAVSDKKISKELNSLILDFTKKEPIYIAKIKRKAKIQKPDKVEETKCDFCNRRPPIGTYKIDGDTVEVCEKCKHKYIDD